MGHSRVLKRAWHLVRSYRALWVFGVILALTTFSWETAVWFSRDDHGEANRRDITVTPLPDETFLEALQRTIGEEIDELKEETDRANRELSEFFARELHVEVESDILAIITVLAGMMLIGYIVAKIASYVSETALIQMVDQTEDSGVQYSVRRGFQMGWSRATWRLFLIDLLVNISAVLAIILLFLLVLAPLALWTVGSTAAGVIGTVLTVLLFFPSVALIIVAGVTLSMLKRFFQRACVLEGLGVIEAIRQGYTVVRQHLKGIVPLWLVTIGLKLAWPFAMIPVVVVLVGVGVVLGGASALVVGGLAALAFGGATPWLVAGAVGIPVFVLTLAAPLAFLGGLREVFLSSTWTLTYRELQTLESVEPGHLARLDTSGLEVAPVAQ